MPATVKTPTKSQAKLRRKALLKQINYNAESAAKAVKAAKGIWKDRDDIDALKVRQESWSKT